MTRVGESVVSFKRVRNFPAATARKMKEHQASSSSSSFSSRLFGTLTIVESFKDVSILLVTRTVTLLSRSITLSSIKSHFLLRTRTSPREYEHELGMYSSPSEWDVSEVVPIWNRQIRLNLCHSLRILSSPRNADHAIKSDGITPESCHYIVSRGNSVNAITFDRITMLIYNVIYRINISNLWHYHNARRGEKGG